jgi:hypothetical protein
MRADELYLELVQASRRGLKGARPVMVYMDRDHWLELRISVAPGSYTFNDRDCMFEGVPIMVVYKPSASGANLRHFRVVTEPHL